MPGAFEIPLVAQRLAATGGYDAVICLGAVDPRATPRTSTSWPARRPAGIARWRCATGVPVIFEVLATEDLAQAEARAGGAHGNKGWEAARGRAGDGRADGCICPEGGRADDRRQALGQGGHLRPEPALVGAGHHRRAGQETSVHYHRMRDEIWVVLDAGLTIADRQPGGRGAAGGGVHGAGRGDPPDPQRAARSGGGCWRSPTATPPRTTPSASRTPTGGRWSPTGERPEPT